jgi:hypothetical protein
MAKTKTGASSQAKATKKATATKSSGKNRAAVKSGGGGSGCSSILVALAELKMIGKNSPTRSMVARMAGYTGADQAGFKKALTGLSSKNYLNYYSSTTLELTDAGSKQVPTDLNPPRTNADLHNRIKLLLPPKARSVFDVLSDGQSHTRMEIAKALGYPNDQVRTRLIDQSTDRFVGAAAEVSAALFGPQNSQNLHGLALPGRAGPSHSLC